MAQRRSMASDTESYYIEKSQAVMGEDAGFVYEEGEEIPPQVLEKLRTLYTQVFGKEGLYHATLLEDLIDKFGVDAVMEAYGYTADGQTLYDMRTKKIKAMELTWQGKDFLTHLLGFEHGESYIGENNYDPRPTSTPCCIFTAMGCGPVPGLLRLVPAAGFGGSSSSTAAGSGSTPGSRRGRSSCSWPWGSARRCCPAPYCAGPASPCTWPWPRPCWPTASPAGTGSKTPVVPAKKIWYDSFMLT